jgi:Amidohydrolase
MNLRRNISRRRMIEGASAAALVTAAAATVPAAMASPEAAASGPGLPKGNWRIDTYAHYSPDLYNDYLKRYGLLGAITGAYGPWSVDRHLAFMDQYRIQASVLSFGDLQVTVGPVDDRRATARAVNDYARDLVQTRGDRFGIFAVTPMPDIEGSVAEVDRALGELDLDGICLLTNYKGTYLIEGALLRPGQAGEVAGQALQPVEVVGEGGERRLIGDEDAVGDTFYLAAKVKSLAGCCPAVVRACRLVPVCEARTATLNGMGLIMSGAASQRPAAPDMGVPVRYGVRRKGTTSVRWWGIVGRAASGVASRATMVTGCWQCGQFRVAVGSSGSRTAAGCREDGRAGGGGSSIRAGIAGGGAWPSRRARSSSRAWSRRCSASRRQTIEQ